MDIAHQHLGVFEAPTTAKKKAAKESGLSDVNIKSESRGFLGVSLFFILVIYSVEASALDLSEFNLSEFLPTFFWEPGFSDFDVDKFLDERGMLVFGGVILVLLVVILGIYRGIRSLRRKGMEYGLYFIKSFQFWLLIAATTLFWFSLLDCQGEVIQNTAGESQCIQSAQEFNIVLQNAGFVFLGFFVVAFLLNWRKSNFGFALVFTTVQSIISALSILVVIGLVLLLLSFLSGKKSQD